ncbi:MAG: DUF2188 domain-containing protein [bacterium]
MAKRKQYHVTPVKKGGWRVTETGKARGFNFETKPPAVKKAVALAKKNRPSQVKIRKRNGRIQDERTYGQDPYPPKG